MGREEQIEEREVLDSIFPAEIQDVVDHEYRITISLDVPNVDGDDCESPIILLQVKYPDAYPDEPPVLDVLAPPNTTAYPFFNVASDKEALLATLSQTAEESIGMAMVFTLVSTLKDNAEQLIAQRHVGAQREEEKKLLAAEEEENKKFHGTPVDTKTFMAWRQAFRSEMAELKRREDEAEELAERRKNRDRDVAPLLTGKQLWERGIASKNEEDYEDSESVIAEAIDTLKITS